MARFVFLALLAAVLVQAQAREPRASREPISMPSVRYAGVHVDGKQQLDWRYPVFVGADHARLDKLNAWVRAESIARLFISADDQDLAGRATSASDAVIREWLTNDPATRAAASEHSKVDATIFFGNLVFLVFETAWRDHGYKLELDSRVFDIAAGNEVVMESLFRPGSWETFNVLLAKQISRTLTARKRESAGCLGKNETHCVDSAIDVDSCVKASAFDWKYLQVLGHRHVSVQYPYRRGVHLACGTEFGFDLKGREVEKLFLTPEAFWHGVLVTESR